MSLFSVLVFLFCCVAVFDLLLTWISLCRSSIFSTLAMVCYHGQDYGQAVEYQQKALAISERVLGEDHPETAQYHVGSASQCFLAVFTCSMLCLFSRLWLCCYTELVSRRSRCDTSSVLCSCLNLSRVPIIPTPPPHMYDPVIFNSFQANYALRLLLSQVNCAMILQDTGRIALAVPHLQEALKRNKLVLGAEHSQTAVTHHCLAVAFGLMGAYKQVRYGLTFGMECRCVILRMYACEE